MLEPRVLTEAEVALLLGCTPATVQEKARTGMLPGLKFGVSWVFPAGALARVLDELALEEAAKRKKAPEPAATSTGTNRRKPPVLPVLRGTGPPSRSVESDSSDRGKRGA